MDSSETSVELPVMKRLLLCIGHSDTEKMRKWFPLDLLGVIFVAAVMLGYGFTSGFDSTSVRIVFGVILTIFAPGYALVSFLIPEATRTESRSDSPKPLSVPRSNSLRPLSVTTIERALLSIGLSVVLIPFVVFVLHYSPWGLGETAFLTGIAVPTLLLSFGAIVRRSQLPFEERFQPTVRDAPDRIRGWYGGSETAQEKTINVVLLTGFVLAVVGVGTAIALSGGGEQYTEFHILSEDPETGEMLADEYPTDLSVGEESDFVVGITNQEGQTETYTLVVQLENTGDDIRSVTERTEVVRQEHTVSQGESIDVPITVEQQFSGENIRLSYLLYLDTPPEEPSGENAYRDLHLWMNVSDAF